MIVQTRLVNVQKEHYESVSWLQSPLLENWRQMTVLKEQGLVQNLEIVIRRHGDNGGKVHIVDKAYMACQVADLFVHLCIYFTISLCIFI